MDKRQTWVTVRSDFVDLNLEQQSWVVDRLSNWIIHRDRRHPANRIPVSAEKRLRVMSSIISRVKNDKL